MKRWVLCVPLSVCLAACGSAAGSGNAATSSPTPASHRLGDAVSVPGWLITLKSLKLTLQQGSTVPTGPDDMLLVLEVTMQNTSGSSAPASGSLFQCRGADGTTYERIDAGHLSIAGMACVDPLI